MEQVTVYEEGDRVHYCGKYSIGVVVSSSATVSSLNKMTDAVDGNGVLVVLKLQIEKGQEGVVAKNSSPKEALQGNAVPVDFTIDVQGVVHIVCAMMNPKYLEIVKEEAIQQ